MKLIKHNKLLRAAVDFQVQLRDGSVHEVRQEDKFVVTNGYSHQRKTGSYRLVSRTEDMPKLSFYLNWDDMVQCFSIHLAPSSVFYHGSQVSVTAGDTA